MANTRGNQKHLGIDTNVLVAYLDHDHPQHANTRKLAKRRVALNPTVVHEAYHTLVFKMKWTEDEALRTLKDVVLDETNAFINHSLRTSMIGLDIAAEYHLGGRDALILANYLTGKLREFLTFDKSLLKIGRIKYGKGAIRLKTP